MAEFLIYNKKHWMDKPSKDRPDLTGYENVIRKIEEGSLNSLQKDKILNVYNMKYNARHTKGDIVEIREDGSWDKTLKNKNSKEPLSFSVIRVEGLPVGIAKKLNQANGTDIIVLNQRRYCVDYNIPLGKAINVQAKDLLVYDKKTLQTYTGIKWLR